MHVVEHEPHRVIADRIHLENGDVLLARDGLALVGGMALHLGARALDAQIFGAQVESLAVVEGDGQRLAVLVQPQLRRPRRCVGHFDLLALPNFFYSATSRSRDRPKRRSRTGRPHCASTASPVARQTVPLAAC